MDNKNVPQPKASAARNEFLRTTKAMMNHIIYKETLRLVREQGEQAARQYLQQLFNKTLSW